MRNPQFYVSVKRPIVAWWCHIKSMKYVILGIGSALYGPFLNYHLLPDEYISMTFESKFKAILSRKYIWKCSFDIVLVYTFLTLMITYVLYPRLCINHTLQYIVNRLDKRELIKQSQSEYMSKQICENLCSYTHWFNFNKFTRLPLEILRVYIDVFNYSTLRWFNLVVGETHFNAA